MLIWLHIRLCSQPHFDDPITICKYEEYIFKRKLWGLFVFFIFKQMMAISRVKRHSRLSIFVQCVRKWIVLITSKRKERERDMFMSIGRNYSRISTNEAATTTILIHFRRKKDLITFVTERLAWIVFLLNLFNKSNVISSFMSPMSKNHSLLKGLSR